jgi:hypothetical protein
MCRMYPQWFKTEHDRLHIVEQWPDGPGKQVALAAVRSAIANLLRVASGAAPMDCEICLNRRSHGVVTFRTMACVPEDSSATIAA